MMACGLNTLTTATGLLQRKLYTSSPARRHWFAIFDDILMMRRARWYAFNFTHWYYAEGRIFSPHVKVTSTPPTSTLPTTSSRLAASPCYHQHVDICLPKSRQFPTRHAVCSIIGTLASPPSGLPQHSRQHEMSFYCHYADIIGLCFRG